MTLSGHVQCPECKAPVTDMVCWVNSEHFSMAHDHALVDTIGYRYEPCGHERIERVPPGPCNCHTFVIRTTPELLAQLDEDSENPHDSARALGRAIAIALAVAVLALGLLIWAGIS